jgi:hypothetical protein
METTKNKLSPYASMFFNRLSNYLETTLYFYGSIQRNDYVPNKSDIDVDIFTENINSTMTKMQNLLGVEKHKFKKFIYKIDNKIVIGYKISIKEPDYHFRCEISVFDVKFKDLILHEHTRKFKLPILTSIAIQILKILHYQLGLLPVIYFKNIKDYLMNSAFEKKSDFLIIDYKKEDKEENDDKE